MAYFCAFLQQLSVIKEVVLFEMSSMVHSNEDKKNPLNIYLGFFLNHFSFNSFCIVAHVLCEILRNE